MTHSEHLKHSPYASGNINCFENMLHGEWIHDDIVDIAIAYLLRNYLLNQDIDHIGLFPTKFNEDFVYGKHSQNYKTYLNSVLKIVKSHKKLNLYNCKHWFFPIQKSNHYYSFFYS